MLFLAMGMLAVSAVPFAHAQVDTTPPTLTGASLDEGTGVLVLAFNENINQTSISDIDPSGFTITDSDGDSPVQLTGAEVSSVNATAISITLDVDPAGMVRMLTTPTLDIAASAVQDTSNNAIAASSGNMIHVTATVGPHNPVPVSHLDKDADGLVFDSATGVAVTNIGSGAYAVVASLINDGVQIIDITNASNPLPVSNVTDGTGGFEKLDGAAEVAITEIDSRTYAVVTAVFDDAISIIDITVPSNPLLVFNVTGGEGGFEELDYAQGVAITEINSKTYALVAAFEGDAVQIIDMTIPSNPLPVANILQSQPGFGVLDGPRDIAVTEIDSRTYAVVTGHTSQGVQIIDITDVSNPIPVSNATLGVRGFERLLGAYGVAITQIDSKTYAVVTAFREDGVQIIDITNASNPLPASHVTDDVGGFAELYGPTDVSITQIGSKTYAVVAAERDSGVQIMDITNASKPLPVSHLMDGVGGFEELEGASGVAITQIGYRTYVLIASAEDDGIQIIDISDYAPPVLSAASFDYDTDVLSLAFNEPVDPASINASKFAIGGGDSPISLADATLNMINSTTMSFALTAGQVDSLDSVALPTLDVRMRAIKDTANNGIAASQYSVERLGTFSPVLVSASLDEANGVLTVQFHKPLDSNLTKADSAKFVITESDGASPVPLTRAGKYFVNDTAISLTFDVSDPAQLANVRNLATPTLDIGAGAIQDTEENPNAASSGNVIHVTATVGPHNPIIVSQRDASTHNLNITKPWDVAIAEIGSSIYALVASDKDDPGVDAVQILNITNPANPSSVSSVTDNVDGFDHLSSPHGITIAEIGSKTYALVTGYEDDAVTIIDITDPANPVPASVAVNGTDGFDTLDGPDDILLVEIDSRTYALVTESYWPGGGLQIIDITDPANPKAASSAMHGVDGFTHLNLARGVATTVIDSVPYALVTSTSSDNGLQIIDISNASDPQPAGSISEGQNGFELLNAPYYVAVREYDSKTYAMITSSNGPASTLGGSLTVADITDPANPVLVSNITDGQAGFEELQEARKFTVTQIGPQTYALVAASRDDGLQIIDVTDPANPLPVASVTDGQDGFTEFDGTFSVATAKIDHKTHAVTVAQDDNGLAIINIGDYAPPVLLGASVSDGTMTLRFDEPINPGSTDMSGFIAGSADGSASVSLAGAATTWISTTSVSVSLTAAQIDALKGITEFAFDINVGSIMDVSQNPIAQLDGINQPASLTPRLLSASLDPTGGILTLIFDRTVSDVDLSKFAITDAGNSPVRLTGAATTPSDSATITITLTSAQLASVVRYAAPGLDVAAGAVRDVAGNLIEASSDNVVSVVDATPPRLSGATLDQSAGILTLVFDEEISSIIDLSGLTIKSGDDSTVLNGASTTPLNATGIRVKLTAPQTESVNAYNMTLLDIAAGTVRDVSGNLIIQSLNNTLSLVDNPPILLSATLDEKTITLTFSERIDTDPISDVNPSWLTVTDSGNNSPVQLTGAMVWPVGNDTIRIIPVQSQMDQIALHEKPDLDILDGAVRDMKQQGIIASDDNPIVRADDDTPPKLAAASLDNNVGILTVTFDEPVNTLKINTTGVLITEISGGDSIPTPLESSTIVPEDLNTIRLILDDASLENLPTHDKLNLEFTEAGAVTDLAGNGLATLTTPLDVIPNDPLDPTIVRSISHGGSWNFVEPNFVTIAEIDSYQYALVTLSVDGSNGINIINVSNPESPSLVRYIQSGSDGFDTISDPQHVTVTEIGSDVYALVAALGSNGVQIINITNITNPLPVAHMRDGQDGFGELAGALGVAVTQIDSKTYAVVAGRSDAGVQIADISNASNPVSVANITDGEEGFAGLDGTRSVAITQIGSKTYAVVTAYVADAVHIIDISDPASPRAVSNATDGTDGFATLDGPFDVAIMQTGSKTYALVASSNDNGVQIIDITDPENPTAASSAHHNTDGFEELSTAADITITRIDNKTYAVVTASWAGHGVQIMDITDPENPLAVGHLSDVSKFGSSKGVATAHIDSSTYAFVASTDSHTLHIIDMTNLTSAIPVSAALDEKDGTMLLSFDGLVNRSPSSYVDLSKITITDGMDDGASPVGLRGISHIPHDAGTASITIPSEQLDMITRYLQPSVNISAMAVKGLVLDPKAPATLDLTISNSALCGVSIEKDPKDLVGVGTDGISPSIPQTLTNAYRTHIAEVRADASAWNADGIEPIPANATEVRVDNGQYWYPMEQNMLITANLEFGEVEPLSFRFNLPENTTMSGVLMTQTIQYMATCG